MRAKTGFKTLINPHLFGETMAWEVWHEEDNDYGNYRIGFWCNTQDISFGPVLRVDSGFDKRDFYKHWDNANLADARHMESGELYESAKWITRICNDYKDIATASLKIFKVKPNSAPYLIHEDNILSSFDMMEFSPYRDGLENRENISEDEYDAIHDLIEQLNEDMKDGILNRNENTTSWLENMVHGVRGEISWKVLDE